MILQILSAIEDSSTRSYMEFLYDKYSKLMYSQVYKLTQNHYEVEEIMQESLLHLIEKVSLLQTLSRDQLVNYIISTTRYTGYAFFRKKNKTELIPIDSEELEKYGNYALSGDLEDLTIQKLESEQIYRAWSCLKERDHLILSMKYILDKSNKEIACLLGVKPDSIRMLLTRAKRNLLSELKKTL